MEKFDVHATLSCSVCLLFWQKSALKYNLSSAKIEHKVEKNRKNAS